MRNLVAAGHVGAVRAAPRAAPYRGAIRPHRLGLGLDLTIDGAVVVARGRANTRVYAVGAAQGGIEWEVASA